MACVSPATIAIASGVVLAMRSTAATSIVAGAGTGPSSPHSARRSAAVTSGMVPTGLSIKYGYDEIGNLTSVTRTGSGKVSHTEKYEYTDGNGIDGHNLKTYIDPNGVQT